MDHAMLELPHSLLWNNLLWNDLLRQSPRWEDFPWDNLV
jgi:hypothetical protein